MSIGQSGPAEAKLDWSGCGRDCGRGCKMWKKFKNNF